jgi:hypothetical protein
LRRVLELLGGTINFKSLTRRSGFLRLRRSLVCD